MLSGNERSGMIRILVLFLLATVEAAGQFTYSIDQSPPVVVDGRKLPMPWAGGLNSAQINTMDLNGDSKSDLVVFDRAANKLLTFLNQDNAYGYAPEYEDLFPAQVTDWMLLRDFNCDGLKDIFTSDSFGMRAFLNTTKPGELLSWMNYEFFTEPGLPKSDIVLTKGFSGKINLKVNAEDIPAIDDVDGDGDLDILNIRFTGIGTIEWHKNFSMERYGTCDSLDFERVTQNFGGVEECGCGQFAFGQTCADLANGNRTQHVSGKTLLTLDLDNDGDRELLFAEDECSRLYLMTNTGTKNNAVMKVATPFPAPSPVNFQLFPAPYLEDVDFDGKADLIVSPNLYSRTFTNALVERSVLYYKNTGTTQAPVFTFVRDNFLQEEMIEVGDYSVPAFTDSDSDGDQDLFIGFYANQSFNGSIYYFLNVGTPASPSFELMTRDFGGLSQLADFNFKPQFADMNGDSKPDLVFTSTSLQNGATSLQYLVNTAEEGLNVSLNNYVLTNFRIGVTENLSVMDVNQDGFPDLLVGKATGALQYWENSGTGSFNNMVLKSGSYLEIGSSPSRQNPATVSADLDADGRDDLIVANNRGGLSIYGDFRNFNTAITQPAKEIIYNTLKGEVTSKNLGARISPAIVNLFNNDKPAIVVGNTLGGLHILKNNDGIELPPDPVIMVFPNPLTQGEDLKIKADRNVLMQVYSILGQKMSEPLFIQANQTYPLPINNLASGLYIARFVVGGKSYCRKFVLK